MKKTKKNVKNNISLDDILLCIREGYDLNEAQIKKFQTTDYVNNYVNHGGDILILLNKPINGRLAYLYYRKELSKDNIVYSRN